MSQSHDQDPSQFQPQIDPSRFAELRQNALALVATTVIALAASSELAQGASTNSQIGRPLAPEVEEPLKPGQKPADGRNTLECRQVEVKIPDAPRPEKPRESDQRIVKGKTVAGGISSLMASFGKRTTGSTQAKKSKSRINKAASATRQNCDSDPDRPSLG